MSCLFTILKDKPVTKVVNNCDNRVKSLSLIMGIKEMRKIKTFIIKCSTRYGVIKMEIRATNYEDAYDEAKEILANCDMSTVGTLESNS